MYEMNGKIYIFDFDGTLADSMKIAVDVVLSFLDERGVSYPDDLIKTLTPLGYHGIAKYYQEVLGVKLPKEEIFDTFIQRLTVAYEKDVSLKKNVERTLRALKARGARLFVLTGSPHAFTDPCLKRTGVYDLFERVWSTDDFGMQKSDERLYREVAKSLGVSLGDLLLIDDGLEVLKTAKRAGVPAIGAYDPYSAELKELAEVVDRYVTDIAEIL